MEGGTQGKDFKDACEMAADWLQGEMEHRAMHGLPFPESTFDNRPRNGGATSSWPSTQTRLESEIENMRR